LQWIKAELIKMFEGHKKEFLVVREIRSCIKENLLVSYWNGRGR
jgi:hypothetical protein